MANHGTVDPPSAEPGAPLFLLDPEASSYFETFPLKQRRELVQHLVEYSSQIILVVGESGIGKTAFARRLTGVAPPTWRVSRVVASLSSGPIDLLDQLLTDLDLEKPDQVDEPGYLRAVQRGLAALQNADLVSLVIVDDVHQLTVDVLAVLLDLAQGGDGEDQDIARLHIIMLSRSDVTRLFGTAELKSHQGSMVHSLDLPRFTPEQTVAFLGTFADRAGTMVNLPAERIVDIQDKSDGVPARILTEARTSLGEPAKSRERWWQKPAPGPRIRKGLIVAFAILIAGFVFWFVAANRKPETATVTIPPPVPHAAQPSTSELPAPEKTDPVAAQSAGGPLPTQPEPNPKPEPVPSVQPEPKPAPVPDPELKPGPQVEPEPQREPEPAPKPAAAEIPAAPTAMLPAPAPRALVRPDHGWFRQQPRHHYVLQLFGAHDRASVTRFMTEHRGLARLKWFITRHQGKPWYVVCYGLYPDRARARGGAQALPEPLRQFSAWARSIVDIQTVMIDFPAIGFVQ